VARFPTGKRLFPFRKHLALPEKVVAVLVSEPEPILALEGRSGPRDQMCLAYNGGSYRWVYVPVDRNAMIQTSHCSSARRASGSASTT